MPRLAEQQTMFGDFLQSGDATALGTQVVETGPSTQTRLGIYRRNVLGNLSAVLRLAFPAVLRIIDASAFEDAAQTFVQASPPRNANLYEYGSDFPNHLAQCLALGNHLALADIARLDWAVHCALHATRDLALALDVLSLVDPDRFADLHFMPHPSLTLLSVVPSAWAEWESALQGYRSNPERRAEHIAVFCRSGVLEMIALHDEVFDLALALASGFPLGMALDVVASDQAAAMLSNLLRLGVFSDVRQIDTNTGG